MSDNPLVSNEVTTDPDSFALIQRVVSLTPEQIGDLSAEDKVLAALVLSREAYKYSEGVYRTLREMSDLLEHVLEPENIKKMASEMLGNLGLGGLGGLFS